MLPAIRLDAVNHLSARPGVGRVFRAHLARGHARGAIEAPERVRDHAELPRRAVGGGGTREVALYAQPGCALPAPVGQVQAVTARRRANSGTRRTGVVGGAGAQLRAARPTTADIGVGTV